MNNLTLINAEEQILNHLIAENDLYWRYSPRLKDEMFQVNSNIWNALKSIISEGKKVNLITLTKVIGEDYFETITNFTTKIKFDIDIETWIDYLEREIRLQKGRVALIRLNELISRNEDEGIEPLLQQCLNDLSGNNTILHRDMIDHVKDIIAYVESCKTGTKVTGFPSGINKFDSFTGGFQLTDLSILAAETSQGKTTLALGIAYQNAVIGNYVGIFSLEMSLRQLTARLLAMDINISSKEILSGRADAYQISSNLGKIINNKILLDNTRNSSLESIISKMRYFISRFGCKFFFVDYLQLISYHKKGNSTEQNLADICRSFKNFAKENDVSIVLLCQLNRDTGGSSVPRLSRLRGSGQIEEAADNVIFIVRPSPNEYGEPEVAKIILAKGRNCGTGNFDLLFTGYIPKFENHG